MAQAESGARSGAHAWIDARVLSAEVAVSARTAAAWLPPELEIAEPARATIFVAFYPQTSFGSVYREAGILLHARDAQGPALHCPWMVVDDDTALILGRELLGFPKKLAEISLDDASSHVAGWVARRGVEVLRIEAELGPTEVDPAPVFGYRMINVAGDPLRGMKRLEIAPTGERIESARRASAKVTLGSSERDPLGELDVEPSAEARYVRLDFGAPSGSGPAVRVIGDVAPSWATARFFWRAR